MHGEQGLIFFSCVTWPGSLWRLAFPHSNRKDLGIEVDSTIRRVIVAEKDGNLELIDRARLADNKKRPGRGFIHRGGVSHISDLLK